MKCFYNFLHCVSISLIICPMCFLFRMKSPNLLYQSNWSCARSAFLPASSLPASFSSSDLVDDCRILSPCSSFILCSNSRCFFFADFRCSSLTYSSFVQAILSHFSFKSPSHLQQTLSFDQLPLYLCLFVAKTKQCANLKDNYYKFRNVCR